jgi:hypothetical protein
MMNKINMKKRVGAAVLFISLAGAIVAFRSTRMMAAHAQESCSGVPKPLGVYGLAVEGFNDGGQQGSLPIGSFYPLSSAGTFTFIPSSAGARSGTVSRHLFVNFGGAVVSPPIDDSGPYSQNPDCTFSATFTDVGEVWKLVSVEGGKQLDFFVDAPGSVVAGIMTRQRTPDRRDEQ